MDSERQENGFPRRERKNNKLKHMTQAYLPPLMILLAAIGLILIVVGAIRGGKNNEAEAGANASNPSATLDQTQQQALDAGRRLMDEASRRAAQYDYDGALSLLNSFSGDPSSIEGMTEAISDYTAAKNALVPWGDNESIPHLSFQPLVADPDRAFDNDENADSYRSYNFTVAQFTAILQQLYDNGYVLVSMHDVALPLTDSNGGTSFASSSIMLPEGKKPLILSEVPVNFYLDTVDSDDDGIADAGGDGFASRLVLDSSGRVTAEMVTASGETVQGAFDVVPVLDAFIESHPSFSYRGAKAILGVTGYDGVLGYRGSSSTAEAQAVAQALLADGYSFASFSYGRVPYGSVSLEEIQADLADWEAKVLPITGPVDTLFYVSGSDLADIGTPYSGDDFGALYTAGFRYFVGMGSSPWGSITSEYVRQTRTTVNPAKLSDSPGQFMDYFKAAEILSAA